MSGAGRDAKVGAKTHYSETADGHSRAYATAGRHRHTPEIEQDAQRARLGAPVSGGLFNPHLVPMIRGILALRVRTG